MNPDKDVIEKIHAMPTDGAPSKLVMHEFTLSLSPLKGVTWSHRKRCSQATIRLWGHGPYVVFPDDSSRMPYD